MMSTERRICRCRAACFLTVEADADARLSQHPWAQRMPITHVPPKRHGAKIAHARLQVEHYLRSAAEHNNGQVRTGLWHT